MAGAGTGERGVPPQELGRGSKTQTNQDKQETRFPYHLGQSTGRHNVTRVHQAVQVPGGLLNRLAHLIVAVEVEHVGNQIQRILVVLHLGVEARQVEAVCDVVLVDFAKVLVAARRYELPTRPVSNARRPFRCAEIFWPLTQSRQ